MPVTIHEDARELSPAMAQAPQSQASQGPRRVTDALGRMIGLRKIGPLEKMRLFKAVGPQNSRNEQYLGLAMLAYMCCELDGETINPPVTEVQVEALVARLGDEGLNAISGDQIAAMGITDADIEAADGDLAKAVELAARRKNAETTAAAKN
jgi:hypothetical protein